MMGTQFTDRAIVLALFYVGFWALIGLVVDGLPGITAFAFTLGPAFAIVGVILMAHDLHPRREPSDTME